MEKVEKVVFTEDRCKGCGLCIEVCPQEIIRLADRINSHGYHPAEVVEQESCISCGMCAMMCPDVVIKVYKEE